jgi:putative FmdB family regulatory protein
VPIYDYRCDHCGHAFSAVQSFKDEPLDVCPSCGKPPRRLIAPTALVFKGSGWYKTDSRASNASTRGGTAEKESGTKTDAKSDTQTEPKSETKPEKGPAKTGEAAS